MLLIVLFILCFVGACVATIVTLTIMGYYKHYLFTKRPQPLAPSQLMWSRMWPTSDHYRGYPTETFGDLRHLKNTDSVIWLRQSTKPGPCDVELFIKNVLPHRTSPFILITSDGDRNVPSEIKHSQRLLANKWLKAWYTQNYDGTDDRVQPIPIGLALHVGPSVAEKEALYLGAKPALERKNLVLSDCHLNTSRFPERKQLAHLLKQPRKHIEALSTRVPYPKLLFLYGEYRYVISLPGNGLDCHRTWEALGLGATVIHMNNSLRPLLEEFRVIFVDSVEQILDFEYIQATYEQVKDHPVPNMKAEYWLNKILL